MAGIGAIALATHKAAKALSNKDSRKMLITIITLIILIPFILMIFLFFLLNAILGMFIAPSDLHEKAAVQVASKYSTSNTISSYLINSIDLLDDGKLMTTQSQIESFIVKYFLDSYTTTTKHKDGTVTKTKHYYFITEDEIYNLVLNPPFSFSAENVEFIKSLASFSTGFIGFLPPPCDDGVLTSDYGYRIHPVTGVSTLHKGVDIAPEHHAPIYSVADGTIYSVNTSTSSYGNYVLIEHDLGNQTIYSFYAHLSEVNVKKGQKVLQCDIIGLEGGDPETDDNAGTSTGHHLHFEIRLSPSSVDHTDPKKYITLN